MITNEQKAQIAAATKIYMNEKGMSQAQLSRYCGVSASYMSNILNGVFTYSAGEGKSVEIGDKHFELIARAIGMSLAFSYWRIVQTPQFVEMISTLEDCKERGVAKMIIGETGCGKSFSCNKFLEANPVGTFKITVSNQHKIRDVTGDIGEVLGVPMPHGKADRMRAITNKLKELKLQGVKPILKIDEAENMTHGMIGLTKGIYDAVIDYCGLAVIGTEELEQHLNYMMRYPYKYPGIKQFRRRMKAGTVHLTPIDKARDFAAFFEGVEDKGLCTVLRGLCDNYGELHDYLEPALRKAAEDGIPLTDEYFRIMYKIA